MTGKGKGKKVTKRVPPKKQATQLQKKKTVTGPTKTIEKKKRVDPRRIKKLPVRSPRREEEEEEEEEEEDNENREDTAMIDADDTGAVETPNVGVCDTGGDEVIVSHGEQANSVQGVRKTAMRTPPAPKAAVQGLSKAIGEMTERERQLLFRVVLSDESMKRWRLRRIQSVSEHLAAGYQVVYGDTNKTVFGRTAILRVRSANLHKLGISAKSGDPPTRRKHKLTLEVGTDPIVDEQDPQIALDQQEMADRLMKAKDRIAELFWETDDRMHDSEISTAFDQAVQAERMKADEFKAAEKMKVDEARAVGKKYEEKEYEEREITRADKDVMRVAKFNVTNRIASWVFNGNDSYPADDPKGSVIRLKKAVFSKKKSKETQAANPAAVRSNETFDSYRPLEEGERGGDGNENDDFSDLTDDVARAVDEEVISQGYYRNRFVYSDHKGNAIPLGTTKLKSGKTVDNVKDPCFRAIDQNDFVKVDFSFWVYVLTQGTFGMSINLGKNICIVRKGTPDREERTAAQSNAAQDIVFPSTCIEGKDEEEKKKDGEEKNKKKRKADGVDAATDDGQGVDREAKRLKGDGENDNDDESEEGEEEEEEEGEEDMEDGEEEEFDA